MLHCRGDGALVGGHGVGIGEELWNMHILLIPVFYLVLVLHGFSCCHSNREKKCVVVAAC